MQRMLHYSEPADFVVATGETHSLKDFVAGCFSCFNLDRQDHVVTSDAFRRPTDILYSSGNPEKAKRLLGWSATAGADPGRTRPKAPMRGASRSWA